jgi:hypothetical protein
LKGLADNTKNRVLDTATLIQFFFFFCLRVWEGEKKQKQPRNKEWATLETPHCPRLLRKAQVKQLNVHGHPGFRRCPRSLAGGNDTTFQQNHLASLMPCKALHSTVHAPLSPVKVGPRLSPHLKDTRVVGGTTVRRLSCQVNPAAAAFRGSRLWHQLRGSRHPSTGISCTPGTMPTPDSTPGDKSQPHHRVSLTPGLPFRPARGDPDPEWGWGAGEKAGHGGNSRPAAPFRATRRATRGKGRPRYPGNA